MVPAGGIVTEIQLKDLPGDPTSSPATLEIWFRPDSPSDNRGVLLIQATQIREPICDFIKTVATRTSNMLWGRPHQEYRGDRQYYDRNEQR